MTDKKIEVLSDADLDQVEGAGIPVALMAAPLVLTGDKKLGFKDNGTTSADASAGHVGGNIESPWMIEKGEK